ncbi:chorismate lyase [Vibrio nitrifigilis]|uniref:Probable chorismate pyruvate-lyase n=1 Tax=Vibrio nitrifigilis TaxID=2789781 RepID=A0ABS0GIB9_9VIBR|nr:chorismate lyase [Vibrio nitrifigilis]MBF9001928.1 chorismate lyase [Vibrio nitrifigilis]
MNKFTSLYLYSLHYVSWSSPSMFTFPDEQSKKWLLEKGSLSRLLAKQCNQLNVNLINNQQVAHKNLLANDVAPLNTSEDCWVREVVLLGDNEPWVIGRTLIPESTIRDSQHDLSNQGTTPLGLTVFSADNVKRDGLEVGWADVDGKPLLARRSRLWMDHKPMLVAELFLPHSPIYTQEPV